MPALAFPVGLAWAIPCIITQLLSESPDMVCRGGSDAGEFKNARAPGVTIGVRGANTASATRAPWVESNGALFLRTPRGGKFLYRQLPKGKAALAAAEAFAFGVEARLEIAGEDAKAASAMLGFLKALPELPGAKPAANIAVIDNGSKAIPEVLNLMVRRNLLFRLTGDSDPTADLNVRIGSLDFPEAEAANPVWVADKARRILTDRKRHLRIFGTEVVIGRLDVGEDTARLHLLNYSSGSAAAIRVRIRGAFQDVRLAAFGFEGVRPEEAVHSADATEFTVPEMGAYAVVDLKRSK